MEDSIARKRYARRTSRAGVRRKQRCVEKKNMSVILLRQGGICVVLLLIALLAKYVDIPATRFVTSKVKHVLSQNVELGELLSNVKNSIGGLAKEIEAADDDFKSNDNSALSTAQTSSKAKILGAYESLMATENADEEDLASEEANISEDAVETSVLAASTDDGKMYTIGMIPPVNGVLSSLYGENGNEITGASKPHQGIDISVTGLGVVKAALDGKVNDTGVSPAYGKYIRILHADGLQTVYANCSDIFVKKGDIVKQADEIAWIGDEDLSVGAHLHFEVWRDEEVNDPLEYIDVPSE